MSNGGSGSFVSENAGIVASDFSDSVCPWPDWSWKDPHHRAAGGEGLVQVTSADSIPSIFWPEFLPMARLQSSQLRTVYVCGNVLVVMLFCIMVSS